MCANAYLHLLGGVSGELSHKYEPDDRSSSGADGLDEIESILDLLRSLVVLDAADTLFWFLVRRGIKSKKPY